ncbi:type II secretion system protein [Cellulomonas sp. zg-ZUI22]|nr:type II secretion system protein [Cellulomonas sp. zg-ZUI22]MBO0900373.1 type II secretion system protein [Cellulomonas sp. zg-ZUI22]
MMRGLRRRLLAAGDRGMTLPEVLVTTMLLGFLSALILGLVSSFSQTFSRDRAAADSTTVAAAGMKELTRVVRSGTELRLLGGGAAPSPVFVEAGANALTMFAYIDTQATSPKPVKVRFSIDAQRRLVETRWAATSTAAPWSFVATGSPTQTRPIARLIPVGADPLFQYLDASNTPLTIPASGFTTDQLRSIAAVRVTLTVQADDTERADPVQIHNAVGIPNRGISRVRP